MRFEIADDLEQEVGLMRIKAGCRLVKHKNPRIVFERTGNGNQLLDRHRIGAERAFDIDFKIEPLEPHARARARLAPGNQSEAARLAPQSQILDHRHRRNQIDFLVDGADAQSAGLAGGADLDGMAVEADFAFVAAKRAGHDFDQGRLARAVFSQQGVHLAGVDTEIDLVKRPHSRKRL